MSTHVYNLSRYYKLSSPSNYKQKSSVQHNNFKVHKDEKSKMWKVKATWLDIFFNIKLVRKYKEKLPWDIE